ncbi:hypothetical protein PISL3812_02921 [Talaromyces islandicus]|uniref:Uncharacterized protein n=1 Tax=Talaromyces islandicus TaxID=28573 RepID=A0A0U1LR91_TALIS|nr:hypothetical protein PISL3812_02921 [Talaromyces islandicus]
MFETLPQHPRHPQRFQLFQQNPHFRTPWMPASPSPLGSCNANIPRAVFSSKMANDQPAAAAIGKENDNISNHNGENAQNGGSTSNNNTSLFSNSTSTSSSSPRQSTYEQRFKSNAASSRPFGRIFGSSTSDETTTTISARANKHRALFLNRVKQDRAASRFNARGESIMMMEHVSEQKDWRETMQRKADAIFQQYHLENGEMSDEDDDDNKNNAQQKDMDVDGDFEQYALEMQEQEMDALLENMPVSTSPAKSVRSFCDEDENDAELEGLFDQIVGDYSQDMDMSG